nr:unnamed protein product [Digitaria exilis]
MVKVAPDVGHDGKGDGDGGNDIIWMGTGCDGAVDPSWSTAVAASFASAAVGDGNGGGGSEGRCRRRSWMPSSWWLRLRTTAVNCAGVMTKLPVAAVDPVGTGSGGEDEATSARFDDGGGSGMEVVGVRFQFAFANLLRTFGDGAVVLNEEKASVRERSPTDHDNPARASGNTESLRRSKLRATMQSGIAFVWETDPDAGEQSARDEEPGVGGRRTGRRLPRLVVGRPRRRETVAGGGRLAVVEERCEAQPRKRESSGARGGVMPASSGAVIAVSQRASGPVRVEEWACQLSG